MKIRIELDVAPNEVPLATELIAVLRSLTDHVNVATSNSLSKPSGSASDALTSSMQLSAGHVSVPHPPCPAIVTPPRQAPPLQAAPSQPQKPSKRDMQHIFTEILRRAEFAENPKQIVQELEAIAWAPTASLPLADRRNETTFRAFVSSWEELALDPTLPKQNRSAIPFTTLLSHGSPEFKDAIRDAIIPSLLKHLAAKRPRGTSRVEFFVHAEAFAGMASVEIVPVEGALTILTRLAKDPARRAAALTALGKLVEINAHAIAAKGFPATVKALKDTVASITDEEFQYDIKYIQDSMNWSM